MKLKSERIQLVIKICIIDSLVDMIKHFEGKALSVKSIGYWYFKWARPTSIYGFSGVDALRNIF